VELVVKSLLSTANGRNLIAWFFALVRLGKGNRFSSTRIGVKKQLEYLMIDTGGYMGNSKGRKAKGARHKADWERLRA